MTNQNQEDKEIKQSEIEENASQTESDVQPVVGEDSTLAEADDKPAETEESKGAETDADDKPGYPLVILVLAVAILFGLSFVPWSKLTGDSLKDFNLLSDVIPTVDTATTNEAEAIDPALAAALAEQAAHEATNDTVINLIPLQTPRNAQGEMVVEDYTPGQLGFYHLKQALTNRKDGPARIAFLGDSYIEGDIITSDLRSLLQDKFGGNGVGYVPAASEVAGFRRSVRHQSSGWNIHGLQETANSKYFTLPGTYTSGSVGSSTTYTGVDAPHRQSWTSSKLMFVAPAGGSITMSIDSVTKTFEVAASPEPQMIRLDGPTRTFKYTSHVPGLVVLGAWMEDNKGVTLDNMSVRGDAGISRRTINVDLNKVWGKHIDYDLVILEYGINALTANKTDYSGYAGLMAEVVKRIRECFPNADILLLGIGDRGHKKGGDVHSMATIPNMIEAQRLMAQKYGLLFWEIREAMGGQDAIVRWREKQLVNADYIHLNFEGGKEVGSMLSTSIIKKLNEK